MCAHRRCRCLAVCTSHAQTLVSASKGAQHLCPFLYNEIAVAEELQFLMCLWYGGSIYDETRFLVLACVGNFVHVLLVVNEHALLLKLLSQFGRSLVISSHYHSFVYEIACKGTHADAACTNEVYCFDIFYFHCSLLFSFCESYHLIGDSVCGVLQSELQYIFS